MRRGLPHPWLPTPSGLCGFGSGVPHTSGNALWGDRGRSHRAWAPSLCSVLSARLDPLISVLPRRGGESLPASLPSATGPLSPSVWAPLRPRGRWGIRPGPAQKIQQGRALQLCAAHSELWLPLGPPRGSGWGEPGRRRPLKTWPDPAPSLMLCSPEHFPLSCRTPERWRRGRQKPLRRLSASWKEDLDGLSRGQLGLGWSLC